MRSTTDQSTTEDRRRGVARHWTLLSLFGGLACAQLLQSMPPPSPEQTQPLGSFSAPGAVLQSLLAEPGALESTAQVACDAKSASDGFSMEAGLSAPLAWPVALDPKFAPKEDWRDMARMANWQRAAELIEALPTAEREQPGARYVLAVASQNLHRCDVALTALEGLEESLTQLKEEITQLRAQCQLEVGPFQAAIDYYEGLRTPTGTLQAAQARFNAGNLDAAFETVQRALKAIRRRGGNAKRRLQDEATARKLRTQIDLGRQRVSAAVKDLHWLATRAVTLPEGAGAAEQFEKLSGKPLTKEERLTRASELANEGRRVDALSELDRLANAPGKKPAAVELAATRAWAHYHTRAHYARAAELFHVAAELDPEQKPRMLYYAAKAHSRSHKDDLAIKEYAGLAKRFPRTGYVEQSLFRIPRLQYGLARFDEAEKGYVSYLERYPRGRYAKAAKYDLAISRLALGQRTDRAKSTFARLIRETGNQDQKALLSHLAGVAQELAEDQVGAISQYEAVLKEYPVTFAALASAARLRNLGKAAPHRQRLETSLSAGAFDKSEELKLPSKAKLLADWGLHTDAEHALFEQRKELTQQYRDNKWQAMCQLYGTLDRGFRRYSLAYNLMRANQLGEAPSAENLWAWHCAYPEPYQGIVQEVESRYQLPESLVHAVMRQESGFRPNVVSPVGAVGLMQLMPRTARLAAQDISRELGELVAPDPEQPTNVRNNVELGGYYLSKLLGMLNDQLPLAVAAYNAGPSAVSRWLQGGDKLPVDIWVARIPYRETRHYVSRVMGNWLAYRYLSNPSQLPTIQLALVEGTRPDPEAY